MIVPIETIADDLGIEKEEVIEFLHEFLDYTMAEDLPGMKEALHRADSESMGRRAHSIKGAALNLKLQEAARLSAEIENKSLATDLDGLGGLVNLLEHHLNDIRAFLVERQ